MYKRGSVFSNLQFVLSSEIKYMDMHLRILILGSLLAYVCSGYIPDYDYESHLAKWLRAKRDALSYAALYPHSEGLGDGNTGNKPYIFTAYNQDDAEPDYLNSFRSSDSAYSPKLSHSELDNEKVARNDYTTFPVEKEEDENVAQPDYSSSFGNEENLYKARENSEEESNNQPTRVYRPIYEDDESSFLSRIHSSPTFGKKIIKPEYISSFENKENIYKAKSMEEEVRQNYEKPRYSSKFSEDKTQTYRKRSVNPYQNLNKDSAKHYYNPSDSPSKTYPPRSLSKVTSQPANNDNNSNFKRRVFVSPYFQQELGNIDARQSSSIDTYYPQEYVTQDKKEEYILPTKIEESKYSFPSSDYGKEEDKYSESSYTPPYVKSEQFGPAKYEYKYAVNNHEHMDIKSHHEARDGNKTIGEYSMLEPDGTILTVKYVVDGDKGFDAVVTRTGTPIKQPEYSSSSKHKKYKDEKE